MSRPDNTRTLGAFRFRFGTAEFDQSRFVLYVDGQAVRAERRPLELLEVLLLHAGEVVTREELLQSVWRDRRTEPQVLKSAIARLRACLGTGNASRIVTQPKIGYRFDGPLERIVVGRLITSPLNLKPGTAIPGREHFRLQSQVGGSTLNEVWTATDKQTGEQRIYKFCADGDGLTALKRESTLSRLLGHSLGPRPDFVTVLATNFHTPPFYLECAYVGPDLLQWSQESDGLGSLGRNERLSLFLQIADAVAAAHGVGVLHKDLKPANILVREKGPAPRICVGDFGSGRLLQPDLLDAYGIARLGLTVNASTAEHDTGTPLYQAPEVAAGEVSTVQSDIYSLGIILYQLLLGDLRAPISPGWEREVGDPLLASDIADATARDPARRLRNVSDLTSRLRQHEARRARQRRQHLAEQAAERNREALARARARRPWVVTAMLLLATGLISSLVLYRAALSSRDAATHQAQRAEAVNAFWKRKIIDSGNPNRPDGSRTVAITEVLDQAATDVDSAFGADPVTAASIQLSLGDAFVGLSEYARASAAYREAHRLLIQARGAASVEAIDAALRSVRGLLFASELEEADRVLSEALAATDSLDDYPTRLRYTAHFAQATVLAGRAQWTKAAARYEQALQLSDRVNPPPAEWFNLRSEASDAYLRLGRLDEAENLLRQMLEPRRTAEGVSPIRLAATRIQLGQVLASLERFEEAEFWLQQGHDELEILQGREDYSLYAAKNALANLYLRTGRWEDALDRASAAAAGLRRIMGAEHHIALVVGATEATALLYAGRPEDSLQLFGEIRPPLAQQLGEAASPIQTIDYYRALAYAEIGLHAKARPLLDGVEADALRAAAPESNWELRLKALRAVLEARNAGAALPATGRVLAEVRACDCAPHLLRLLESVSP